MEKNAINKNGSSARDLYSESSSKDPGNKDIKRSLKCANVLHAKEALKPRIHRDWLKDQRDGLMVAASLIATMAFQFGVNPPGGVWQDDNDGHTAGFSIMVDKYRGYYDKLLVCNTISLVSSLSVILLLISGLPNKRFVFALLMVTMWSSVTATTLAYFFSVVYFITGTNTELATLSDGLLTWGLLISVLILWYIGLSIKMMIARVVPPVIKLYKNHSTKATSPPCV